MTSDRPDSVSNAGAENNKEAAANLLHCSYENIKAPGQDSPGYRTIALPEGKTDDKDYLLGRDVYPDGFSNFSAKVDGVDYFDFIQPQFARHKGQDTIAKLLDGHSEDVAVGSPEYNKVVDRINSFDFDRCRPR